MVREFPPHKHVLYLDKIEERVLKGLQQRLSDRRLFKSYLDSYNREKARLLGDTKGRRKRLELDLADVTKEYERAVDLVIRGVLSEDDIATKLKELKVRKASIELSLKAALSDDSAFELHEPKMSSYLEAISGLAVCSSSGGTREVHSAIRELIEKVVVEARPKEEPVIEVHGSLATLVRPSNAPASGA